MRRRYPALFVFFCCCAYAQHKPFNVVEAGIPEMRAALEQKKITSRELVVLYLTRIALYEDKLHCIITVNPHVLEEADERDRERAQGHVRGPLHGIPIALKDNILTHDIVTTGGSSSGVGTAANFWPGNVGSETSGSILSPSNQNMLVGIKPTVGRISRYGVIPITADQDTAGPMAKSVTDAAIMLGALESAAPDPQDAATKTCTPPPGRDYTKFLKKEGLKGARIGIPRAYFYEHIDPPVAPPGGGRGGGGGFGNGLNPEQASAMTEAIAILKAQGAEIVDPVDIPSVVTRDPANSFLMWGTCAGADNAKGKDADCSVVLKYGMKRDFNKWLGTLGPSAPVKTLTELRIWNMMHTKAGSLRFGQSDLDISDEMDVEADKARYETDRAKDILLAATHGIDEVMKANHLDALLFPGASSAAIAAKPGYPTVIVPFGMIPNAPTPPFPGGFEAKPAPFGVAFTGTACTEPRLIEIAYAFEQATKRRVAPASVP